jgi:hypothetical protein
VRRSPLLVESTRREGRQPVTQDGWAVLGEHNAQLAYRYIEIMCQMNWASYATARPEQVVRRMVRFPCEYYYYAGGNYEVVCGVRWNRRMRRWRLMSVGFVGAVRPAEALELVVERGRHFFREKRVDHIIAIEPAKMENPAILEFYRLIRGHPSLEIRGTHRIADGTYLWIRMRA